MRPADSYQAMDDGLQADVMRFMAIIALCMLAILALVREAAPAAVRAPAPAGDDAVPVPRPPPRAEPRVAAEPAMPALRAVPPAQSPDVKQPRTAARRAAPPPASTASPAPAAEPAPMPDSPAKPAEPTLSLRFASDQDFLRLVNRGAIRVFAFNDREVLALAADFHFEPAASPGRVHELLPETIPSLVAGALAGARAGSRDAAGYRWGVVMPDTIAQAIRRYLDAGASGELVIDRFGEVRHREA